MVYYKFYHYEPSLAAACTLAALFLIASMWHMASIMKHKALFFIPVVVGGAFEVTGYIARAISASEAPSDLSLGPYVVQSLMLLVAPPLFAATLYMQLGRIILALNAKSYSLISPRWMTIIFVISDVICFVVQLGGAGLMASSKSSIASTGSYIILTGLLLQIVIFGFFGVAAIVFQRRVDREPTPESQRLRPRWTFSMRLLYITSACILIRNIVRVAEFVEGFDGYIILHEAFLYTLDATPMLVVMIALIFGYSPIVALRSATNTKDNKRPELGIAMNERE